MKILDLRGALVTIDAMGRQTRIVTAIVKQRGLFTGIELVHMIQKAQYQHPQSQGSSPTEKFYLITD